MRDLLNGKLHYRVFCEDYRLPHPPIVDPETLAGALPHGSGLDTDWYMRVYADKIVCKTEFHEMNDIGYYTRWCSVHIIFRRDVHEKLYADVIKPMGDLGDYLHDMLIEVAGELDRKKPISASIPL